MGAPLWAVITVVHRFFAEHSKGLTVVALDDVDGVSREFSKQVKGQRRTTSYYHRKDREEEQKEEQFRESNTVVIALWY